MITPLIKTRFNLAAKLNFLTILLILVTSAGISIFVFRTESLSYYQELLSHGRTIADMTSKNCEYGIYTEDRLSLLPVIESLSVDPAIAYVSVMNRQDRSLVSKVFKQSLEMPALPFSDDIHGARGIVHEDFINKQDGRRYIEIFAPVAGAASGHITDVLLQGPAAGTE